MENISKYISKLLYGLAFLTLFLPAIVVPSCSGESKSSEYVDSTYAVIDSIPVLSDTNNLVNNTLVAADSIGGCGPRRDKHSILLPDGQNFSFWGYLFFSLKHAMLWAFFIFLIWSGLLRIMNRSHLKIAVLSTISLMCMLWFLIEGDGVVWGFWWCLGVVILITLINWIVYFLYRNNSPRETN